MLKTAHGGRKLCRPVQLMSVYLPARSAGRRAKSGSARDNYLSFSLFALGVSDFAAVCPRQLAVQSACAARQSFEYAAYGMSLIWLSGCLWLMLHVINI